MNRRKGSEGWKRGVGEGGMMEGGKSKRVFRGRKNVI
jgi:hypothetical protein